MNDTMVYFTLFGTYSAISLEFVVVYQCIETLIIIIRIGVRHKMDKKLSQIVCMTTERNMFRVGYVQLIS